MENKVALITGSNRGIGAETAITLAKKGINVIINYAHHKEEAETLVEQLNKTYNIDAIAIKCDISIEKEVEEMTTQIIKKYGRIDILVNNASICNDSILLDKTVEAFRRIIDVNLIGTYLCSKYIGKIMIQQKYGTIVNIASTNAIDSYYPESCDYDASKAGVISLTHNLAREFSPYIRVNCICPGWVNTEMNKGLTKEQIIEENKKILLQRFAEPSEIAEVINFLIDDKSSYINDSIIKVDGGRKND